MTRTTSAEAHRKNKESGYLSRKQQEVYNFLKYNGGMTAENLTARSGIAGAWKRLSELSALGLVAPWGFGLNRSGHKAIKWNITGPSPDNLPGIPLKAPHRTRKQLEADVTRLEWELEAYKANFGPLPQKPVLQLFFFTHARTKVPSPYYTSLDALRACELYKSLKNTQVWTGTHESPVLLSLE